jgi:hypothetical protein
LTVFNRANALIRRSAKSFRRNQFSVLIQDPETGIEHRSNNGNFAKIVAFSNLLPVVSISN